MWLLENALITEEKFYFLVEHDYTIGRKDCTILILNDSSVSRRHAVLTVKHTAGNMSKPEIKPTLTLSDSSKFGSSRNGSRVATGDTILDDGDIIVFGGLNTNKWRVIYDPLVVVFSSLVSAEKRSLKSLTLRLGGHVLPEWSVECTHLIMTELMVTIKVIGALVTGRPIVTPEFLHQLKDLAEENCSCVPDPLNFQPPLIESTLKDDEVSFNPNSQRKSLLLGKTVVFLAQKQFKQLGHIVHLAGGNPLIIDEGLSTDEEQLLIGQDTIVMYADPGDQTQVMTQAGQEWVVQVMNLLKSNNLRAVPQSELGLAILYSSIDVHCNPRLAQAALTLLHPMVAPPLAAQEELAPQSQCSEVTTSTSTRRPQDESRMDHVISKKRIRDEDNCMSPAKIHRKELSKSLINEAAMQSSRTPASRSVPMMKKDPEREKPLSKELKCPETEPSQVCLDPRTMETAPNPHPFIKQEAETVDSSVNVILPSEHFADESLEVKWRKDDWRPNKSKQEYKPKDNVSLTPVSVVIEKSEDVIIPPSDTEGEKDLIAMEMDEGDGESGGEELAKWKQKSVRRNRVLLGNEESDPSEDIKVQPCKGNSSLIGSGFISATKPIKSEQTSPQDGALSCDVVVIQKALAIRKPLANVTHVDHRNAHKTINFKMFKKASFAGQFSMPSIIGGTDLVHHGSMHIPEAVDMMDIERKVQHRKNKEDDLANRLFDWDPKPAKRRR